MGLTVEGYAEAKKLPLNFLKKLGLKNASWRGTPVVVIPYGDASGEEACVRIRAAMDGDRRFFWKTGAKPIPYGLWRKKQQRTKYMVLAEGESDCHSLWMHRFPALGLPGANSWKEEWAQYLDRFERIYVVLEPDRGGAAVLKWLGDSTIHDRVRLVRLDGVKDTSELYLTDPKNFSQAWKAAMKAAIPGSKLEEQQEEKRQQSAPTQANRLIRLADTAQLFHTTEGEAFASVAVDEHTENWPLRSRHFRHWLLRGFYLETKSAPQHQALQEAISVLESKATFEGSECPVFVRLAEKEGKIYVDLCDDEWKAVEIDANGWRVLSQVPVRFRRARGMSPLSYPVHGGLTKELRRFVNVASEADWHLLEAWLMAALRPRGPYPILVLHGEQGSAKSTTSRVLRALVDPSTAPLRSEPRELRDLMIAASNVWVINLDNLSRIHTWLSDALCRLSTGGGFGTRELFTDRDETLFSRGFHSLLEPGRQVKEDYKSVDHREIIDFFLGRLRSEFEAVAEPKPLHNSKGSLLFLLIFAAGNAASAKTGIKIANSIKF